MEIRHTRQGNENRDMSVQPGKQRVLFVCLGNICRSPLAQGVFLHQVAEAGLGERFDADSAGTAAWHIGKTPDPKSISAAARRGIDLTTQRARQVSQDDFSAFDLILAMDQANHAALREIAPDEHAHKVRLFLDDLHDKSAREVPDPYYGGDDGFEQVLDLIEDGTRALLSRLNQLER